MAPRTGNSKETSNDAQDDMIHIFWFQHHYWPLSVRNGKGDRASSLTLETEAKNIPLTLILFKCNCGKIKTKLVEGEWTLDEVKEKVVDIIADKIKT